MFFRPFLVVLLSLSLLSCAGEDQPFREDVVVDFNKVGVGGACLEDFGTTLESFFVGEISKKELNEFWGCMINSVSLFVNLTEGKANKESYTPRELRNFLHRFFLGRDRISDGFLLALMEVKRVFVGGSVHSLSKEELQKGVEIFKHLKKYSLSSLPFMKLYMNQAPKATLENEGEIEKIFIPALENLRYVSQDLSELIKKNGESYSFQHLKEFIFYFLESTKNKNKDNSFRKILGFIPLIQKIKVILIGGNEEKVLFTEWDRFFKNLYRILNIKMRVDYFLSGKSWTYGRPLNQLHEVLKVFYKSVDEAIFFHSNNIILHNKIKAVIIELAKHIRFPLGLSGETISQTWVKLVDVVLRPIGEKKFTNNESTGLDKSAFDELKQELARWFTIQQHLNEFKPKEREPIVDYLSRYHGVVRADEIGPIEEVVRALDAPYKFIQDGEGRLLLSSQILDKEYDHESLFAINWKRAIVRLLIRGYSETEEQRNYLTHLTREQLQKAFRDFFELVVAIGIADKNESPKDFVSNLHQLSNLFLVRSDGDENISFEEGLEYFIFALGGINAGNVYFKAIDRQCPSFKNDLDEVKDIKCVKKEIHKNSSLLFGHLPEYHEFFNKLCSVKDKRRCKRKRDEDIEVMASKDKIYYKEDFLRFMELATGRSDLAAPIKASEMGKQIILAEYVENYILLNDRLFEQGSKNGRISLDESLYAFPRFKVILWNLAKGFSDRFEDDNKKGFKMTKGLYTWLMRHGERPESFLDFINFWFWYKTKNGWKEINTDRTLLLRILGTLAADG